VRLISLLLITLALAAVAPQAATNQTPAPAATPAFAVAHYDISASVTPSTSSLEATATLSVKPRTAGSRSVRLYLHKEFSVRRVTERGRPVNFVRPAEADDPPMYSPTGAPLDIDLGRGIRANEDVTIEVAYGGPISGVVNGVNLISPSLTELAGYAAWFPIEKENGSFRYLLRLTLPTDHVAVTDGRLVETARAGSKTTHTFRRDAPGFDIPVVAGPDLNVRERREGSITARAVFRGVDDAAALASLDGVVRCAAGMTRLYGAPGAAGAITVVFSPRSGWGYSRVPLIVVPEAAASARLASPAGRLSNFLGLAHETAHFWWNLASTTTSDDWINEALAEYAAMRIAEEALGERPITEVWRDHHWRAAGVAAHKTIIGTLREDGDAYALYYQKGSAIFRSLETTLGRPALDTFLVRFYQEHQGRRDATTDGLLAAVRRDAGSRFDPFFDRYVRRGGLPALRFDWHRASRVASGTVVLDDAALVGFPLTIVFRGDDETALARRTLRLTPGTTTWRFELPFNPRVAVVDPDVHLLRANPDAAFSRQLVSLVHGPGMDFYPETISTANIGKASTILADWKAKASGGPVYHFELGWLALLEGRAQVAIEELSAALASQDELPTKTFYVTAGYCSLGMAHDLAGDRARAVRAYRDGIRAANAIGVERATQAATFQNYLNVPYPRGKSIHVAAGAGNLERVIALAGDDATLVNTKDDFLGLTPILWAVRTTVRRPIVEWLAGHGADLNVKDGAGRSVLDIVIAKEATDLAAWLRAKGVQK